MTSNLSPAVPATVPATAAEAADAALVAELLGRYLVTLDDEEPDDTWARGLFTEDAVVTFPMSRHAGLAGLAEWHRASLTAFASTQHLGSPAVVSVGGDRAAFRANVLTTHVHHPGGDRPPLFRAGTLASGGARRTAAGWRMDELSFRVLFTEGQPPQRG
ncbi:nuclear transport factor 2 family protein [Streptomyces sp. CHD11]|uniref:nuclear transport factor 2 family protein n=1 Tax=Streptomyces sp. CHD11 TaxID=2741325 RepID=UPI001BFC6489|nr:nuclear transport factor 2 family protein [Streptomyces sp. CHD11]MBT3154607.1 nuclear transport factor 2 family protein [Streptomyces sp. CHD11]